MKMNASPFQGIFCLELNPYRLLLLGGMLHNNRLNGRLVRSNNLLDPLAILEEYKCWHSSHFQLCGNLGLIVDIDFVEACVGVGIRKFDDLGGNDLARTTPGCECINHQEARLLDGILILLSADQIN